MYTIEKNVPVPEQSAGGARTKYPFAEMHPGDSFIAGRGELQLIRSASAYYRRRYKMKFVIKPEGDASIRIWRIN